MIAAENGGRSRVTLSMKCYNRATPGDLLSNKRHTMEIIVSSLLGLVVFLQVPASTAAEPPSSGAVADDGAPLTWESTYTPTPPVIDGVIDEVWRNAKPLTVVVREAVGGHNPRSVVLRALHTNNTLFVMAQWPDQTKSAMRDPYVWEAAKKIYERPTKPDDQFAIEFPLEGDFDIPMLTLSHRYVADVWHWKAGRGNPVGWVDDKRHVISQEPIPGAAAYSMGGHGTVYIARPLDQGTPAYIVKPKPTTFQGELVDSFEQVEPTGSLADVRGKGVHNGKMWTLEMSRRFNTGHTDDAVIDPKRHNLCAIAVLDDELYWEHSVSPKIILHFVGAAGAKASRRLCTGVSSP